MSPLRAWIFLSCHATPLMRFITFHIVAVSLLKGIPEWKIVYLKPSPQGDSAVWPLLCGWQDLTATNTPWVNKEIQYMQCWLVGPCITQVMPKRKNESHITLRHSGLPKALIPSLNLGCSLKKRRLLCSRTEVPPTVTNWHLQVLPKVQNLHRQENAWMDLNLFFLENDQLHAWE